MLNLHIGLYFSEPLVLLYNICANHIWSTLALTEPAFEKYFGNTKTLSALLVLRTNFIEHQRHLCNMPHCIGLLYPLKALLYCTIIAAMLHNCSRMRWMRWMRRTRRSKRLSVTGSTVIHHSLTVHKTDYDAVQYTLCNNHTLTNTCSAFSQSRRFHSFKLGE